MHWHTKYAHNGVKKLHWLKYNHALYYEHGFFYKYALHYKHTTYSIWLHIPRTKPQTIVQHIKRKQQYKFIK